MAVDMPQSPIPLSFKVLVWVSYNHNQNLNISYARHAPSIKWLGGELWDWICPVSTKKKGEEFVAELGSFFSVTNLPLVIQIFPISTLH